MAVVSSQQVKVAAKVTVSFTITFNEHMSVDETLEAVIARARKMSEEKLKEVAMRLYGVADVVSDVKSLDVRTTV